jgi:hypothetical protein
MANKKTRDERFAVAVAVLGETFGRQVTAATIHAYEVGLEGIPIDAIEVAAKQAMTKCKFMPVPAELRELAGELAPADRAIRAWQAVVRAVHSDGYYHSVNFDDPVINATLRNMGGWERFNERLEEEPEVWLRKAFETTYTSFAKSGISAEAAAPLGGFIDRSNAANGYLEHVRGPKLIECGMSPHRPGVVPAIAAVETRRITDQTRELVDAVGRIPE